MWTRIPEMPKQIKKPLSRRKTTLRSMRHCLSLWCRRTLMELEHLPSHRGLRPASFLSEGTPSLCRVSEQQGMCASTTGWMIQACDMFASLLLLFILCCFFVGSGAGWGLWWGTLGLLGFCVVVVRAHACSLRPLWLLLLP